MCLAIPGKVIEIQLDNAGVRMAKANFGGIVKQVCLEYTPEVNCGDYVLVHVGFALSKVDEAEVYPPDHRKAKGLSGHPADDGHCHHDRDQQ